MAFTPPPPIATARLVIRFVREEDLPDLLAIHRSDEVTRYLPYTTWRGEGDARAWYERALKRHEDESAMQFVIALRDGGRVIGTCMLFRFEPASARAELGYVLGRDHWGRGYMREALGAFVAQAFGALGLRRIEAEIDPRNRASERVLQALGFEKEGQMRQRWQRKGEVADSAFYALLRPAPAG